MAQQQRHSSNGTAHSKRPKGGKASFQSRGQSRSSEAFPYTGTRVMRRLNICMSRVCGRNQKSASAVVPGCGDDLFSAKTNGIKQINMLRNTVANIALPKGSSVRESDISR
jgi:hypothetical protein